MKTTTEKLIKTANSLSNHVGRGNSTSGSRSLELIDRYTELRNKAIQEGVWNAYCQMRGATVEHDAYDFFA